MGGDGPPRGGTRGGRDQFDWEAVKSDKDREFYLGASVKASVGRWQKGRDILWYTRDKEGGPGGLADELAAVKAEEERLMQEALGLRPVTERRGATALDAGELKELLKRSAPEGGAAGGAAEDEGGEATRVKGVGYTKTAADLPGAGGPTRETLPGLGPAPPPQQYQQMQVQQRAVEPGRPAERTRRADSSSSSGSEDEAQRKARKRAKKDAKRAKKEAKRARADRSRSREPARRRSRSREPRRRERERSRDRSRDRSRSRDRRRDEPPRR